MEVLKSYIDSEDSLSSDNGEKSPDRKITGKRTFSHLEENTINVAPLVTIDPKFDKNKFLINPSDKEVLFNPKYEELYGPMVGPANPFKKDEEKRAKNIYTGFVQSTHLNDVMFENQRLTFHSLGYANDPSIDKTSKALVGDKESLEYNKEMTLAEKPKEKVKSNRKKEPRGVPEDVHNFKGPWAQFVDEVKVSTPNPEQLEILQLWIKEKEAKKEIVSQKEPEIVTESATLHLKQSADYQSRGILHPPMDLGVNFKSTDPPELCFLPKKHVYTWRGHNKGVTSLKLFPVSGHLMLSGSADTTIKLWECYRERRMMMTYKGHVDPIKDLCFDNDGKRFLSSSHDRYIKLWDTETGSCIGRFTTNKVANCIRFNPDQDKQHLFIACMADKKMITWDINSNEIVQEYDRHLGPVNSVTFIEENRRIFSTSDDRTARVWEWDIPVDTKYIADPSMHSMPAVTLSPDGRYLACQSMDNRIVVYDVWNKVREKRRKVFRGHIVSGNHCQVNFSPDNKYLISGDSDGKMNIWNWKTTKILSRFQAHEKPILGCAWLPHETSKIVTSSLDGLIKMWD